MNTDATQNISRELYNRKFCACCGINGITKKITLHLKYSYRARLCFYCIEKLEGIENARTWLEKNASYDAKGNIYFPKVSK
jgi:hypothetical protein